MGSMDSGPSNVNQQEGEKKPVINLITELDLEEYLKGLPSIEILEDDMEVFAYQSKVGEGFVVGEDFDVSRLKELADKANNLVVDGVATQVGQDNYIKNTVVEVAKIVLARMYLKRQTEKDTEIH